MVWSKVVNKTTETTGLSLEVYHSKMYMGTANNGLLFEWDGVSSNWNQVVSSGAGENGTQTLSVYKDKLFAGMLGSAKLFEWNVLNAWILRAPQLNSQTMISSLIVFNGKLYGGTSPNGLLFEWNDVDAWVQVAPQLNSQTKIHSLVEFNSKLYGSTNDGRLFEWNDVDAWVQVAPKLGTNIEVADLKVFSGELYGCSEYGLVDGGLLKWNGADAWIELDFVLNTTEFRTIAIVDGVLYLTGDADYFYKLDSGSLVQVNTASPFNQGSNQIKQFVNGDYKLYSVGFGGSDPTALLYSDIQGAIPVVPSLKDKFANQGDILIGL